MPRSGVIREHDDLVITVPVALAVWWAGLRVPVVIPIGRWREVSHQDAPAARAVGVETVEC